MEKIAFEIDGFSCEACVRLSTMRIGKITGVKNVLIGRDGFAEVVSDRKIGIEEITKALKDTEYRVVAI